MSAVDTACGRVGMDTARAGTRAAHLALWLWFAAVVAGAVAGWVVKGPSWDAVLNLDNWEATR